MADHECKQEGRLAVLETQQTHILESLERLEVGVLGNGKRGLRGEMDDVGFRLTNVESAIRLRGQDRNKWDKRLWGIVMVFLAQMVVIVRLWIGG